MQEGDFCLPPDAPVAQRSLLVKVRDKEEQHVQWTLVPPTDREFLHWHQLLQKKIYEVRRSALSGGRSCILTDRPTV